MWANMTQIVEEHRTLVKDAEWRAKWHTRLGRRIDETEGEFYERLEQTLQSDESIIKDFKERFV